MRADSVGAPAAPADPAELAELSESERERLRDLLGQERAVSARRRALHARLDFIRSQGDTGNAETANQIEYLKLVKERDRRPTSAASCIGRSIGCKASDRVHAAMREVGGVGEDFHEPAACEDIIERRRSGFVAYPCPLGGPCQPPADLGVRAERVSRRRRHHLT